MAMQTLQELGPWAGLNSAQIQAKANAWREEAAYTRGLGALSREGTTTRRCPRSRPRSARCPTSIRAKKVELLDRAANTRPGNDQRAEIDANRRERNVERVLRVAEHEVQRLPGPGRQRRRAVAGVHRPRCQGHRRHSVPGRGAGVADTVRANGGSALRPIRDQEATLAEIDAQIAQSGARLNWTSGASAWRSWLRPHAPMPSATAGSLCRAQGGVAWG